MYTLSQKLLSCRGPYPSYLVFLYEQMTLFRLKSLTEGRDHQLVTIPQFLDTLSQSDFSKQNLLCEFYLHEVACPMNIQFNPIPHIGDVHLRGIHFFCY